MLRHKYTKKRLRHKYNKKTRKRGGVKNPKRKISSKQREEAKRLSVRTTQKDNKLSHRDEKLAQQKMARLLGEPCIVAKYVSDLNGKVKCPTSFIQAKKKFAKLHPDKNKGCVDYSANIMQQYTNDCYGDSENPDRKWDKHDREWRNENYTEFYNSTNETGKGNTVSGDSEKSIPEIPSSCKKPAPKVVCRMCGNEGFNDPQCKCCPGTKQAAKEMKHLENQSYVNPSKQPLQLEDTQSEDTQPEIDKSQTYLNCRVTKIPQGRKVWTRPNGTISLEPEEGAKETIADRDIYYYFNNDGKSTYYKDDGTCDPKTYKECGITRIPKGKKIWTRPDGSIALQPEEGAKETINDRDIYYYTNIAGKSTYNRDDGTCDPVLTLENAKPEIDYSQTYKECRAVKIPVGAKYWTRPNGSIAFQPEEGAKETIGDKDIYYYYNNAGKSTYNKDDGTCDPVLMLEDSKKVDASNTYGSCREMKIPKGTKYWLLDNGKISFGEVKNAQEVIASKDHDYFYNRKGETTLNKDDGTCGRPKNTQQPLQLEDTKSENVEKTDNIDKFMKIWMSTHFSTLQEQDKNSPNKVVTWLLS